MSLRTVKMHRAGMMDQLAGFRCTQSAGCFPSSIATAVRCLGSVTPSDAALSILSAIFAFVAVVRLATSIWSTAASKTDFSVDTNSGSKSIGDSFGDDGDFRIKALLFASLV